MDNLQICPSHSNKASHFCSCQSSPVYLCSACLSKHASHDMHPLQYIHLYRAIGNDELKRRIAVFQICNSFLDQLRIKEAATSTEAQRLLDNVAQRYQQVIDETHYCFTVAVRSITEEIGTILTSAEYRVSILSELLLEKSQSLNCLDVDLLVAVPFSDEISDLADKSDAVCSQTRKIWQDKYEELLKKCISEPYEQETYRPLYGLQRGITEIEGPVSSDLSPATSRSLEKFGVYPGIDMEPALIKRRPVKYANGVYTGQWNPRLQRHGYGVHWYLNEGVYEGEWRDDLRHGKGRMISNKGDMYTGDWEQDKKTGFGEYILLGGDTHSGKFLNDKREGEGCYRYANGDVYFGEWHEGDRTGLGALFSLDGEMEMGLFNTSKLNGKGLKMYSDGDIYAGEFRNEDRHGFGRYLYKSNQIYQGLWEHNKKHGPGLCIDPGDTYQGTFLEGKKNGSFKVRFSDGSNSYSVFEDDELKRTFP